jgi:ribose transport system ATP-binding protein
MIYQELSLARPISIAENILAGRLPAKFGGLVDRRRRDADARAALQRVGLDLDPSVCVEDISQHEAQLVEIAKALQPQPCILVMDEPTSALSRAEVDRLFTIIRKLRDQGLAIVYISHHLPEIFRIADRVTVLRDGRRIETCAIGALGANGAERLVELMVGRAARDLYHAKARRAPGAERLAVRRLTRFGFFHDITFSARAGEIVGLGGLSGAGRTELARAIAGVEPADRGEILVDGQPARPRRMSAALARGIAYLTEDRKTDGLALRLSVRENALAALIPRLTTRGFYSAARGAGILGRLIEELQVAPPDPAAPAANLSGGNQQKVLLAKWLAVEPRILILDEPTRGVDIGAKVTIHRAIERLAERGNAVILISSDLPELVSLSDRILIMRQGHLTRELPPGECNEEAVLLAANGGT